VQAEACWLNFSSPGGYPFLLKVAAGKVNAVNGKPWDNAPDFEDQDYVEVPGQPWLDGFCVEKGVVRQFVAMPLGAGATAEEQITGRAEHGGVQLLAHPLKAALWEARLAERRRWGAEASAACSMASASSVRACMLADMGLAPGGSILQSIAEAQERPDAWDLAARSRCFVHLANSLAWQAVAGEAPPTVPPTAADYARAGLPWFEWYADRPAKAGWATLAGLKSVVALARLHARAAIRRMGPQARSLRLPLMRPAGRPQPGGRRAGASSARAQATASASTSTLKAGLARPATISSVLAGAWPCMKASRFARQGPISEASVRNTVTFTMLAGPMSWAASSAPRLASAWSICATGSSTVLPSGRTPTWPESTSRRPSPSIRAACE
jgi:hypothetical protein